MKTLIIRITLLLAFSALISTVTSCDKVKKKVKGVIAGQVMDHNGSPVGFASVILENEDGEEVGRQSTNDQGGFFIGELETGTYTMKILFMGRLEMPITSDNASEIKLGMGRTLTLDITVGEVEKDK